MYIIWICIYFIFSGTKVVIPLVSQSIDTNKNPFMIFQQWALMNLSSFMINVSTAVFKAYKMV